MCGIAGWIGTIDSDPDQVAELMKGAMLHRGPDEQYVRHFDGATLIHNRLRILDLSPIGAQPMTNEDGTVWIVFNGEIYNYRELKERLIARGHIFKSKTDTEVLIHLYEEKGVRMLEDIKGMFAFCIYDTKTKEAFFARDRFGIKPFYYSANKNFIAFASEINAIKKVPGVNLKPDEQSIFDYLSFLNVPAPATFYEGIRCLMPGEYATINAKLELVKQRYHTHDFTPDTSLSLQSAVERSAALMDKGVDAQMESDVPLGSLLSGGIDSSLVSYYAQKNSKNKLNTFNVKFTAEGYDETWAAVAVAERIGSNHRTLQMGANEGTWEHITKLLLQCGQPFADTSLFAVNGVSHIMRKEVTVALSGDGGDEAFGGYTLYAEIEKILKFKSVPRFIRNILWMGIRFFRLFIKHPRLSMLNRAFTYFNDADEVTTLQNIFVWLRPEDQQRLWNKSSSMQQSRRFFEEAWSFASKLDLSTIEKYSTAITIVNTNVVLTNDFLFKVDTASMKESLEIRVPMLDEDLFAYGITLPHRLKVNGHESKFVLRELSRKLLPLDVANKPKQGFGIPVDEWTTPDFKIKVKEKLLNKEAGIAAYLNRKEYEPWIEAFCENRQHPEISREGLYQRIIMLLSLELHLKPVA